MSSTLIATTMAFIDVRMLSWITDYWNGESTICTVRKEKDGESRREKMGTEWWSRERENKENRAWVRDEEVSGANNGLGCGGWRDGGTNLKGNESSFFSSPCT